MIQIKTLLCFFFAALSFLTFHRGIYNKWWLLLSFLFFVLSLLSKTASVGLPILLMFYGFRNFRFKNLILILLPFLIAGLWSGNRILSSKVTQESLNLFVSQGGEMHSPAPDINSSKFVMPDYMRNAWRPNVMMILKRARYYFEQAFVPLKVHPIKGNGRAPLLFSDLAFVAFLTALVMLLYQCSAIWYLISAYSLLVPFLGIVSAPYMHISWVGDQHLYLALPVFIAFGILLLEKIACKKAHLLALILIPIFVSKTNEAANYYKGEVEFFEASLEEIPDHVPTIYNLAITRIRMNEVYIAKMIVDEALAKSKTFEGRFMEEDPYFGRILYLKDKIKYMKP